MRELITAIAMASEEGALGNSFLAYVRLWAFATSRRNDWEREVLQMILETDDIAST